MIVAHLEKALERRREFAARLEQQGTDCWRFLCAQGEGVTGLVIEKLGPVGIFQFHTGKCEVSLVDLKMAARWCVDRLGIQAVYLKTFAADRSASEQPDDAQSPTPFVGTPLPETVTIHENHHAFLIRPFAGLSTGLFLDQRDNRKRLAEAVSKGARVLNLFSYTCGFSVYAAGRGAQVTSVDVSSKYLEWGKENFAANGLAAADHRFFCADARYFLKAAVKRAELYDQVIVDPPSFARGKKNEPFSVKRDLGDLLEQCARVLSPGGTLFVSTNFSQWGEEDLERVIEKALGPVHYREMPAVPQDFRKGDAPILYRWFER